MEDYSLALRRKHMRENSVNLASLFTFDGLIRNQNDAVKHTASRIVRPSLFSALVHNRASLSMKTGNDDSTDDDTRQTDVIRYFVDEHRESPSGFLSGISTANNQDISHSSKPQETRKFTVSLFTTRSNYELNVALRVSLSSTVNRVEAMIMIASEDELMTATAYVGFSTSQINFAELMKLISFVIEQLLGRMQTTTPANIDDDATSAAMVPVNEPTKLIASDAEQLVPGKCPAMIWVLINATAAYSRSVANFAALPLTMGVGANVAVAPPVARASIPATSPRKFLALIRIWINATAIPRSVTDLAAVVSTPGVRAIVPVAHSMARTSVPATAALEEVPTTAIVVDVVEPSSDDDCKVGLKKRRRHPTSEESVASRTTSKRLRSAASRKRLCQEKLPWTKRRRIIASRKHSLGEQHERSTEPLCKRFKQ